MRQLCKKSQSTRQSMLLSTFVLAVSMLVVKIIGALFKIPLMNLLGESGMAYFSSAYSVFTAVYAVTVSGLTGAAAKLISAYDSIGAAGNIARLHRLSVWCYLLIGACGSGILFFGAEFFADQINCPRSGYAIAASSLSILFCCCMAALRGYYEGMGDMRPTAFSQIVEACGKLIFGLLGVYWVLSWVKTQYLQAAGGRLIFFGESIATLSEAIAAAMPYAAAAAMLGVSASSLLGLLFLLLRRLRDRQNSNPSILRSPNQVVTPRRQLLFELLSAAFPITAATFMMQLVSLLDTTTIMKQLTPYYERHPALQQSICSLLSGGETPEVFQFGVFSACLTIFNLIPAAVGLVAKAALPSGSRIAAQNQPKELRSFIRAVLITTLYVTLPMAFGCFFLAKPILSVLYSRQPNTALYGEKILQLLGIAALFAGITFPLTALFQAAKRFWTPVLWQGIGVLAKAAGNLLLINRFDLGIEGAAAATILAYAVMASGMIISLYRQYGSLKLGISCIKLLFIGGCSGAAARFVWERLQPWLSEGWLLLVISIAAAAICCLIGTILCKPIQKDTIIFLSNGEKLAKGLEKFRIIR